MTPSISVLMPAKDEGHHIYENLVETARVFDDLGYPLRNHPDRRRKHRQHVRGGPPRRFRGASDPPVQMPEEPWERARPEVGLFGRPGGSDRLPGRRSGSSSWPVQEADSDDGGARGRHRDRLKAAPGVGRELPEAPEIPEHGLCVLPLGTVWPSFARYAIRYQAVSAGTA